MWLPDDGFYVNRNMLEQFYYFNYFNSLRIFQFVCFSWKIKCLMLPCVYFYTNKLAHNRFNKMNQVIYSYLQ